MSCASALLIFYQVSVERQEVEFVVTVENPARRKMYSQSTMPDLLKKENTVYLEQPSLEA